MKNKKFPTLTIGIPAYNEEVNIKNLLDSILAQEITKVNLRKILVVSDGSTDRTIEIVKEYQKKFSKIQISNGHHRHGKASALNKIYRTADSDFLLTIDADIVFAGKKDLDFLASELIKNPKLNMVGPLHIPTKTHTFFGNLSRFSYLIFRDAALKIDRGNNFYGCMSSEFMRKKFYKSYHFPAGTLSDQCYAYAMSIRNGKSGFKLVKSAKVIFGVAQTFHDWRVLSARSVIGDKEDMVKHFGKKLLKYYRMPKELYLNSVINYFMKNPIYTIGALVMNIYIRKFPYKKEAPVRGVWQMVSTSKELII